MKAIITGGTGFIGSHVAEILLEQGHQVLVLDDLSGGFEDNVPPGAAFEKRSVMDPAGPPFPILPSPMRSIIWPPMLRRVVTPYTGFQFHEQHSRHGECAFRRLPRGRGAFRVYFFDSSLWSSSRRQAV